MGNDFVVRKGTFVTIVVVLVNLFIEYKIYSKSVDCSSSFKN